MRALTAFEGARLPRNHQLVLAVVRSLDPGVHATTREIFAETKRRQPQLGYSTVYRALLRLRDLGLIAEVNIPGFPSAVYESVTAEHAHFHCENCGRIEDVDYVVKPAEMADIVKTDHRITSASLILHGVCAECARTS